MSIIQLIILLVVVGLLLWLVNSFIPMQAQIKQILNGVVVIAVVIIVVLWILGLLGVNVGAPIRVR